MDKKSSRDKRKKNLSFKPDKYKKNPEPQRPVSAISKEPENTSVNIPEEVLPNNWTRYEIRENDDQEGADFETLLQEPISNNSHFKFKSEQNWDTDIKSQLGLNKYFTLDLKLIGEGISTIPFPKRHNYNENLFNYVELDSIKRNSETNSQRYKKYLANKFPVKDNKIVIKKNDVTSETIEQKPIVESKSETFEAVAEIKEVTIKTVESKPENEINVQTDVSKKVEIVEPKGQRQRTPKKVEDDVDDLLNLKISQENILDDIEIEDEDHLMKPTKLKQVPVPQAADLEQWLDDILDD